MPSKILRTATRLAALGTVLALAFPGLASASCPDSDGQLNKIGANRLERSVLCLINEQRTNRGVSPVRSDARLERAARRHSSAMVADGFFAHDSPGGIGFIDRIRRSGYVEGAISWLAGENLAWGTAVRGTPSRLLQAWMGSPGHRHNLLRPSYRDIGIAAAAGTPYNASEPTGVTVTTDFGYRRTLNPRPRRRQAANRLTARASWR